MAEPDNTSFLLELLQTRSMFKWLVEFFTYSRNGVAEGWFDEERVFDQFKSKIIDANPTTFLGNQIRPETVDWPRLYEKCKGLTQPPDWERKSLRLKLEKRGVDPVSFGWDLEGQDVVRKDRETSLDEGTQPTKSATFPRVRFETIHSAQQITDRLAPQYRSQVGAAGPIIGALSIQAHFHRLESPPSPSPVAAHLVNTSFLYFNNLSRHLNTERKKAVEHLGRRKYRHWTKNIRNLAEDPDTLLALSVALLTEAQMTSVQGSTQDILLAFLSPLVGSPSAPLHYEIDSDTVDRQANAEILGVLHAGQVPFLLVTHSAATLEKWWSHLEAASTLLVPQVVTAAEIALSEAGRNTMHAALASEAMMWQSNRPSPGKVVQWEWLPRLM